MRRSHKQLNTHSVVVNNFQHYFTILLQIVDNVNFRLATTHHYENYKKTVDRNPSICYNLVTMNAETKSFIQLKLATNASWATRAVTMLYTRQTSDEQMHGKTSHLNGIGFSGCDAEILSSFAKQLAQGRTLSPKQMAIVFRKMPRYWRQIASFIPQDKMDAIVAQAKLATPITDAA